MKIVYSFWQAESHMFCDREIAEISHKKAKENGYKTCLYTDKIGYDLLSDINYDEIIFFDDLLLSQFSKQIWSLGKILAMSLVKEPFVHIDFDVFLFKKINENFYEKDFFALHREPWIDCHEHVLKIYELYPDKNNINFNFYQSFNFAIAGGKNFEKINYVCKNVIDFAIEYKEEIEKIQNIKYSWERPVIFEQIMIPHLLKTIFNIETETIFPFIGNKDNLPLEESEIKKFLIENFVKNSIIHLHGNKLDKFKLIKKFI